MRSGSLSIVQACTRFYRGTSRSWMEPDEDVTTLTSSVPLLALQCPILGPVAFSPQRLT